MTQMSWRARAERRGGGPKKEPKVIRNRFKGTCACGARVPAGAGVAHLVGSQWEVECITCAGDVGIKPLTFADRQAAAARLVAAYKVHDSPHFFPESGVCAFCKGDVMAYLGEKYGTTAITGCPLCCYSYCE